MVIKENNENLYMQIWDDLPKYILIWKKCFACSCEGVYIGVCVGMRKGDTHRCKKFLETQKKSFIWCYLWRRGQGPEQKENTLNWILYYIFYTIYEIPNTKKQITHQFLCTEQKVTICINIKWMLKAKYTTQKVDFILFKQRC